jgi:hypothetical protein
MAILLETICDRFLNGRHLVLAIQKLDIFVWFWDGLASLDLLYKRKIFL